MSHLRRRSRLPRVVASLVLATLSVSAVGLTGAPSAAAHPSTTAAPVAGRAPATGSLDTAALQQALDAVVAAGYVGVTVEVVGPDGRWAAGAGVRDLARPAAARSGDRTRVASVTKLMVATLVLQEVQRGRWTLDSTIGSVWPGLLPGHDGVTLRQLLSHTSGAPDYLGVLLAQASTIEDLRDVVSRPYTDAQLVAAANQLPWLFAPGTQWSYSNTNYVVLGMLLERMTGQRLGQLLERRVFRPAGMVHTDLGTSPRIRGVHLTEYARLGTDPFVSLASFDPSVFSGAGAVVSTVADLDRFHLALSRGLLLSPALVEVMRTPVLVPGNELGYGLGTYQLPDACVGADGAPLAVFGHDGASFGTFTLSYAAPDGSRRVSISYTGRPYPFPTSAAPYELLYLALAQTCPTPAAASSPSSPSSRQAPQGAPTGPQVPRLPALADARTPSLNGVGR